MNPNHESVQSLKELLYQLADDDFLIAYRGSEWLGLAPHIEEDVAYSSINQNTMGHAVMFYQLLEALGEGEANDLAHARSEKERRNAIVLERPNGEGHYLHEPHYDFAYAVVRHYFYEIHKKIRLNSLQTSRYEPLREAATKILTEQYYHLMHWEVWFKQLMTSNKEAREKMEQAIRLVWKDYDGLMTLGSNGSEMHAYSWIESEQELRTKTLSTLQKAFDDVQFSIEQPPGMASGNGRNLEHTDDLKTALDTLSEVYRLDPKASW